MISLGNFFYRYFYIKFNKRLFSNIKSKKKILVEFFEYPPSIVAFSIFANFLSNFLKAEIQLYIPVSINFKIFFKILINKFFFLSNLKIYNSFGAHNLIIPIFIKNEEADNIYNDIKKKILKKEDILKIKIKNIPIGDLIYDEYLRRYNFPTIDIDNKLFFIYLKKTIRLYLFWYKKIDNNVEALIISHSVYHLGLPARIAIYKNIKVYNIGMNYIYSLNKKKQLRLSGFQDYKKIYKKIKKKFNINIINFSKKEIITKFEGKTDITQIEATSQVNTFKKVHSNNHLIKNDNKNIVVAAHCFSDAVHAYGKNIFLDFYEWIKFLGEFSLKSKEKYNWLIKIHPAHYERNYKIWKKILYKYPSFVLLPKNCTHHEILKLSPEVVLTVYGSVGYEYPFFKIPVINACKYGPHIAFDFNYNPQNKRDYLNLLENLHKLKEKSNFEKNIQDASKFYFLRFLTNYEFMNNLNSLIKKLKDKYGTDYIYYSYIKKFNEKDYNKKIGYFEKFVKSGKFRIYADNTNKKLSKPILFY